MTPPYAWLSATLLLLLLASWAWWQWRQRRALMSLQDQLEELVQGRRSQLTVPPCAGALTSLVLAFEQAWHAQQTDIHAQKRLVADASHQLRTPLAVLRTQLQSVPADPWVTGLLQTLDRATAVADEWLMRLKIEQRSREQAALDQPTAKLASASLDDMAREAALEFAPLIAKRGLQFSLDAAPQAVRADAWMLGELVRNLLANAIRHTPDGSSLGIVVRAGVRGPELVVWDQGQGIADDDRERLFEPFAAATGGTGVGLGLSICRQLAAAMQAEVQLFNRSDGERVTGVDAVVRWAPGYAASTHGLAPHNSPDPQPPAPPLLPFARNQVQLQETS